jgi:ATP synthase protein I
MAEAIEPKLESGFRKITLIQLALTLAMIGGFYYYQGQESAEAALYGGCMALFNTWLAQRRVRFAAEIAKAAPGRELTMIYIGAVERFIFTLIFFVAGMAWLKLEPIPLLAAFGIAQMAYMAGGRGG